MSRPYEVRLSLTQDSGYLGAASWADALCETTAIGFFNVTGELALCLALHAVRLAGVTFLGHVALLLSKTHVVGFLELPNCCSCPLGRHISH